jgi:hypothetical protein
MRVLKVRFFDLRHHYDPLDMRTLGLETWYEPALSMVLAMEISDWMTAHPEGKVDVVWVEEKEGTTNDK